MKIEKNRPFLLKLPEFKEVFNAVFLTKENKDYILITFEDKRIFKICLNAKNESEYYERFFLLNKKLKNNIINFLEDLRPQYYVSNFNYDSFFTIFEPLKFDRNEIQYSLSLEEPEDYLKNNEWIAKTIEIKNQQNNNECIVFIYRYENKIVYGIIENFKKIAKYVFHISNGYLSLIKEERYNCYEDLNFLELKENFKYLTTTSHEMQKDIACQNERDLIAIESYKRMFGMID